MTLRLAPSAPHPVLAVRNSSGASVTGVRIIGHTAAASSSLRRAMAVEVLGGADVALERLTVSGGVRVTGGWRHTLTRSDVSNPHGAAGGHCIWFANAGDAMKRPPRAR